MSEAFWKKKYYDRLEKEERIKMGQAINLAQNELINTCTNPDEIINNLEKKSKDYFKVVKRLMEMFEEKDIKVPRIER